ncbi:MAG: hypothetical protein IT293_22180 [Deltaproteobacteria bacterium]|nr:hypothetical protein [Deltaproteobacteria bacterium]
MRLEGWGETTSRAAALAGVLGLALVTALGAGGGCRKTDPAASLKERASAYWGLKQSKGWPEVYDKYVDPEARKSLSRDAFLKRRFLAFDILSYEISDVKQDGDDKATVAVRNEVNFPLKTPEGELTFIKKQVTTNDQWVRRDGVWYVVMAE